MSSWLSMFSRAELYMLGLVIYVGVEFAGYKSIEKDFEEKPLTWEEYIDILLRSEETSDILRKIMRRAIIQYPVDKICFGKELEQMCKVKAEHPPADEREVIHTAPLFSNDELFELIQIFIEKVENAYYQQVYKVNHPKADEADFLRSLKTDRKVRREVRKSVRVHISHIDYQPLLEKEI